MKKIFYNLFAFLFGCILLVCIFFILELVSRPIYERDFKISIQENPPINIYTEEKQKVLNPGIKGSAVIKKGKLPPITYTYSIDKKGRRNTYQENDVRKKTNSLFMGCSFTFGTGVNDNETFPSQFAKLNPYCQVYNYGMPGGSPQEMYLMTLNPNFADDIENMPTVVVYTFISDHLKRLIGDWSILGKWGNNLPHIELIHNKLHILGNFNETKPFSCFFANTLYKSTLLSILFNQFGIDYPPKFTYKHYELLYQVLLNTKINISKHFSEVHFVVLFYPGSTDIVPKLYDYLLNKKEFIVLDYFKYESKKEMLKKLEENNEHKFPDGHPKPIMYKYLAEWLTQDLLNMQILPY